MTNIRVNKKALKIAAVLAAVLLTATVLTAATAVQNQNQNTVPLINAYLQGISPNPNNAIIQPKADISSSITFTHNYTETIYVIASDIVINGNGFYVSGSGSGDGFYLDGRSNVTIYNVTVTGWTYGFRILNCYNNTLSGNTAKNNTQAGFYLYSNSNNNTLSGNTATNNTNAGFRLNNCSNNTLSGNTASNNSIGFDIFSSSNNNTLSGNNANNNTLIGFALASSSNNNFSNNTANNHTNTGFYLSSSFNNNTLSGNTANNNTQFGFFLSSSSNNTLSGNTANNDGNCGFNLYYSSNNTLSGNTANNNYDGFYIQSGSGNNTLTSNTASNNSYAGFQLFNCTYNDLSGNTASNNKNWFGFILSSNSSNNTLSSNTATNNPEGFYLSNSSDNTLSGNNATNNGYGFHLFGTSTGNNLPNNTALNSTSEGYNWGSCINNNFTGSVVANYLRVNVTDVLGYPIIGADVNIVTNGTSVYSTPHFIGTDPTTDSNGVTPWIAVAYRTFITNDTMITNTTDATVYYQGFPIAGGVPRTVSMSTSHVETFQVTDNADPTVTITFPAFGGIVYTGVVWINGTFNGTGSNVISITINTTLNGTSFTLVGPSGPPYGVMGNFSFRATITLAGEFDVNITVQDGATLTAMATRHIVVLEQPSLLPALLLLAGTKGGTSPLVYAAIIGVVGVVVVAGGLIYYFRRVKA